MQRLGIIVRFTVDFSLKTYRIIAVTGILTAFRDTFPAKWLFYSCNIQRCHIIFDSEFNGEL